MLTILSTAVILDPVKLSDFIRSKRQGASLSLREVAQRCAVDVSYLSRVESGQIDPSESVLAKLSTVLDVSVDELMLLSGRLPASMRNLVEREPTRATNALRSLAAMVAAEPTASYGAPQTVGRVTVAIEDGFPFDALSEIAEVESWRKEVYRPIYHIHKWWAQRLGSVFRAVILGSAMPKGTDVMKHFYQPVLLPSPIVFDPFMGSGTTLGEAHKLGCTVVGRDINPVAWRSVRTALGPLSRDRLVALYEQLEATTGREVRDLYRSVDRSGHDCDVLYYFWVKTLACPDCAAEVDLFSSYVFGQHAYPKRHPTVQVLCPGCRETFEGRYENEMATCPRCSLTFNQNEGPARRSTAVCNACSHEFPIARTAKAQGRPPGHRLYAKLVLTREGRKEYLPASALDLDCYSAAVARLRGMERPIPTVEIADGFNTKQVLNYGYSSWDQMFNDRQLVALSLLAEGIKALQPSPERDALMVLFSGVLEFNNMFASYKGEGTGAVRHMFAHHVLKPERVPIEANVWGTPKSSGSFSTLFKSRLLRAIDYREAPFEISVSKQDGKKEGTKVFGVSPPMGGEIIAKYPKAGLAPRSIYISCGDSSRTDLPAGVVDMVVTDPPFFDNVHYSELADFFHVWQRRYFDSDSESQAISTRNASEVQDTDPNAFAEKLKGVFAECNRVLRNDGLLVFSYHHSRDDGWSSIAHAVLGAGFTFVQSQPVKAEMSVAMPKIQAKEPIDLDVLLICRKRGEDVREFSDFESATRLATDGTKEKVVRFNQFGRKLSKNDVLIMFLSQLLVELCPGREESETLEAFAIALRNARHMIEEIHSVQSPGRAPVDEDRQAVLFPEVT